MLLIAVVAAFVWLVKPSWVENEKTTYDALLPNTAVVFSFSSLQDAKDQLEQTSYKQVLESTGLVGKLLTDLALVDSSGLDSSHTLLNAPMLAAPYPTSVEDFDFLYLVSAPGDWGTAVLSQAINTSGGGKKLSSHTYKEQTVHTIILAEKDTFNLALTQGILLVSRQSFLVEDAIAHLLGGKSLLTDPEFKAVVEPSAEASMQLFVNYGKLGTLTDIILDKKKWPNMIVSGWGGWSGLELMIRQDELLFTGYTTVDSGYLSKLSAPAPASIEIDQMLPANTAMFLYRSLNEADQYYSGFYNLKKDYGDLLGQQEVWGVLESLDDDPENDLYMVSLVEDTGRARLQLEEMVQLSADMQVPMSYQGIPIYTVAQENLLRNPMALLLTHSSSSFAAIYDRAVYWANDVKTLKEILSRVSKGKTLKQQIGYQGLRENLATSPNEYLYIAPGLLNELISSALLGEDAGKGYLNVADLALQYSKDGKQFFTFGIIRFNAEGGGTQTIAATTTDAEQVWTAQLDTAMQGKYWYVKNHYSGLNELLVQDMLNQLYLIDNTGKILWKKQLDGPILDDVHQVDLYRNDKLQLVFATAKMIYLLDRNGNNVEQFPIKLPATAVSGLSLVEYDHKRRYRYFVACDNYKIYGYYANGKPLPGWSPKSKVGTLPYPLQYAVAGGKDYLIMTNIDGTLLLYDRKGDRRIRPVRLKDSFSQPFYITTDGGLRLHNCSDNGTTYSISAIGAVQKHEPDSSAVSFKQVFAMGKADSLLYVFLDSADLRVQTAEALPVASTPLSPGDMSIFKVNKPGSSYDYIGLSAPQDNKVYCFTPGLELLAGFPIPGDSYFEFTGNMYKTGGTITVVGDASGQLSAYRLPQ